MEAALVQSGLIDEFPAWWLRVRDEEARARTFAPRFDFLAPAPVKAHNGFLPAGRDTHAGLLLSGAGVRSGARLPLARQIDLAPTVALLLGFDMPGVEEAPLEAGPRGTRRGLSREPYVKVLDAVLVRWPPRP